MPSRESESPKILGVPPLAYAYPLWWSLKGQPGFRIETDIPATLARELRYQRLHGALLTPIDYARDYAMYRIIPTVAVSSRNKSRSILLSFSRGLRSINTIAINPASTSEIVLTQLVLAENYDIRPTFVPVSAGAKPQQTDATLHVGDPSTLPDLPEAIDLVEEWTDLTELPYVHCVWVARESDLARADVASIIDAGQAGGKDPTDIIRKALPSLSAGQRMPTASYTDELSRFEYSLGDAQISSLTEFLRMAYYHGILQDIADVKMYSRETTPPH